MEPEIVIGRFLGGCFQNTSEDRTGNKSLRLGKGRAVDFELAHNLIRISTPRRDGLEQSRRSGYRNHRSCHHGLRSRPFLILRMSAELMGVVHIETDAVTAQVNNRVSCLAGSSADFNASR